ncbi:major facilitator superfamily domain-containing protein 6 [Schistocerca cancellata]|uniref:major facilitator superfamily domain-containing protein 6 n=1 Tax=Schistocerca cancellata TaxID=274614 RepID=UPI002118D8FB|nr:major facilitator superfamily domain-containing protein 6 [Schistocerca cancellata]XP_049763433.1 major facilitator superfamily domain-containing protein 6 [Schistocerca cancellata]XP_049763441.1 major facilitator superfamily domain-containing protein 6 [Schistocerca cancellata]
MPKINYKLLPVKAHYFFFMASLGPILHQLNVFGKQLGVSEVVIGGINAILPILFLLAKPVFGFVADYFRSQRKLVFMLLVCSMNVSLVSLYFVPQPKVPFLAEYRLNAINTSLIHECTNLSIHNETKCGDTQIVLCDWTCDDSFNGTGLPAVLYTDSRTSSHGSLHLCLTGNNATFYPFLMDPRTSCDFRCAMDKNSNNDCLYGTAAFWIFVILMSLGTIGFNVSNSVSDAICFDVLGSGCEMKYGRQRVWGTIGFGATALISGYAVDWWSGDSGLKDYTPAFILVLTFAVIDLYFCTKLELPVIPRSESIFKDLKGLLRLKHILVFLMFATLAGIVDSFIIYFLFWYLEDLAMMGGGMNNMKLLEGLTIAAETLVGEVIFFSISGKILKLIGYGHSLTLCFLAYALRLSLISLIPSPWWVLPIELFMQGPTYAMCYTTIVAYASAVSPPGASATMQGIVAGMDDGFGYAIGSMIGGLLYRWVGGTKAFKWFGTTAAVCGLAHYIMYQMFLKKTMVPAGASQQYKSPDDAVQVTDVAAADDEK